MRPCRQVTALGDNVPSESALLCRAGPSRSSPCQTVMWAWSNKTQVHWRLLVAGLGEMLHLSELIFLPVKRAQ